jgi:hypothetical protein
MRLNDRVAAPKAKLEAPISWHAAEMTTPAALLFSSAALIVVVEALTYLR